jgi:hypothetical protein
VEGRLPAKTLVRLAVAAALGIAALAASAAAPADDGSSARGESLEAAVKATYLYKFVPFVEWPATAFASPVAPFVFCVATLDPVSVLLERAVRGQRLGERPIAVHRVAPIERGSGCHALYIGIGAAPDAAASMLNAVRGNPVLTITDSAREARGTGIIDMVLSGNRVRFNINANAAAQNGIVISSKLLSLALHVQARE